jgi:hypothetical protein
MTAVALQHRDEIISLAATGAKLSDIAAAFGVQAPAISKHLSSDPDYQAARETAAQLRLEQREAELEKAPPAMAEISRASQLLSHQRWRCEREFPQRWAQRTHTTVEIVGDLGDRLRRAQERLIDGEVVSEQHDAAQQLPDKSA